MKSSRSMPAARASSVASACEMHDDLPHVLFTGAGANAAVDDLVAASGRTVVFDETASAESIGRAVSAAALTRIGFSQSERRCVGIIRDVGGAPRSARGMLKRALEATGTWWIMSSASEYSLGMPGLYLVVRTPGVHTAGALDAPRVPPTAFGDKAVAAGATTAEMVGMFASTLVGMGISRRVACELSCRLDVTLNANKRPLLTSTLVDDALEEAERFIASRSGPRPA